MRLFFVYQTSNIYFILGIEILIIIVITLRNLPFEYARTG